jgi:hypothetical protein
VSSTDVRGTLDILWSCLFTLLICTWTVQHLNVPKQTPDCDKLKERLFETLKRSRTKIKWMIVTLMVPEFLVGRAIQDYMMAKKSRHDMRKFAQADRVEWTWTHAYYANMGGFILEVDTTPIAPRVVHDSTKEPSIHAIALSPSTSTGTGNHPRLDPQDNGARGSQENQGVSPGPTEETNQEQQTQTPDVVHDIEAPSSNTPPNVPGSSAPNTSPENAQHAKVYAYPNADQIHKMREDLIIKRLLDIPVKQISDKSKGDAFIKGTAILQVLWLIIQVIARGIKHLPVSQLEIAVIAFAACTIITYIFSFPKPQNVTVADLICSDPIPLAKIKEVESLNDRGTSWSQYLALKRNVDMLSPIPNDADFDHLSGSKILTYMDVGMVGAGTIFGSLHLIAWNFHFPTPLESLLWKLSSVYLAAVLPCYYFLAFIFEKLRWLEKLENPKALSRFESVVAKGVVGSSVLSYCVARLCLLVLVFRSLLFLDPETFVTTWARNFPHLQ